MSPQWQYRFIERRDGEIKVQEVLTELWSAWKLCQPLMPTQRTSHAMMLSALRSTLETMPTDQAVLASWHDGDGPVCYVQKVVNLNTPPPLSFEEPPAPAQPPQQI